MILLYHLHCRSKGKLQVDVKMHEKLIVFWEMIYILF
jgi:hypothetical protein